MLVTIALSVALAGIGGPSIAGAAEAPNSGSGSGAGGEINSWSLSPSGVEPGQPGARPTLSYSLSPGASVNDSVTLRNYGNVTLTFHVYATDALNNVSGDFALLAGDKHPHDLGSWVKIAQQDVSLAPGTGVEIPITITVPTKAEPGDHTAGIVASSRTEAIDKTGREVTLDLRVGTGSI